jgi:hypothetical protein
MARRIRRGLYDPAQTIVYLNDNAKLIERDGGKGIGSMMAKATTNMYLLGFETRHVIVEKDFVKIDYMRRMS